MKALLMFALSAGRGDILVEVAGALAHNGGGRDERGGAGDRE